MGEENMKEPLLIQGNVRKKARQGDKKTGRKIDWDNGKNGTRSMTQTSQGGWKKVLQKLAKKTGRLFGLS